MSMTLNVELPEEMMDFVREEAAARGLQGAEEYVRQLIEIARIEHMRAQLAGALAEGFASPIVEMGEKEWDDLRRHVREYSQTSRAGFPA